MLKPRSTVVEKAISVAISVLLISAFSTYVQGSSANQTSTVEKSQTKQEIQDAIDKEIEAHKAKIKELRLREFSEQKTPFTDEELAQLLSAIGFEGKALKVAWAVVKKESSGRPLAFNGNTRTGDSSYGIFQINMIGGLGVDRRAKYDLNTNTDLFDPVVNAEIAFLMSNKGENWSSWHVGDSQYSKDNNKVKFWLDKFPEGAVS
jgi:hypothetical protein